MGMAGAEDSSGDNVKGGHGGNSIGQDQDLGLGSVRYQ